MKRLLLIVSALGAIALFHDAEKNNPNLKRIVQPSAVPVASVVGQRRIARINDPGEPEPFRPKRGEWE